VRALVIQHDDDAPAGLFGEWLAARGAEQDVWLVGRESRVPDSLGYDLIVSLGSAQAAYDDAVPWMQAELTLLRGAFDADVAILGICFGSQILARALGGQALRASRAEIGWVAITTRDPEFVAPGPWCQWHYDTFTPPPGAAVLAESPAGPQAFTLKRSFAVQFHPEVTPEIVGDWVADGAAQLVRAGLDGDRLLAETRDRDSENRDRARQLFDAFWVRVGALSGSRSR